MAIQPVFQTGHHSKVNKLRFNNTFGHLISISDDGKIIVWDVNLGMQRQSVLGHEQGVVDFDHLNDSVLVTLGYDNHLKFWSLPDLKLQKDDYLPLEDMTALTVIDDNTICLVSKHVFFYDIKQRASSKVNYTSKDRFTSVDYDPKRNELAIAGERENYTATVTVKNGLTFSNYLIDKTHKVRFVAGNFLFQANTNGTLRYYDYRAKKKRTYHLNNDLDYISDMAFSNSRIALSTAFGNVLIVDQKKHKVIQKLGVNGVALTAVDFSKDGNWLAAADVNGTIYLYDAKNFRLNQILKSASPGITDLISVGDKVYIGYENGVLRQIDLLSNRILSNSIQLDMFEEKDGINYAIYSIDQIVGNEVRFTALKTNRHHVKSAKLSKASLLKCRWLLKENLILIDKDITQAALKRYVNKLFYSTKAYRLEDILPVTNSVQFKNHKFGFKSGENRCYKIEGRDTVYLEKRHEGSITGMEIIPKHQLVLTYSRDGSIRFWDKSGTYLASLYLCGQYNFVYFNPESYYFASKEILNKIGFLYHNKLYAYEQYDLYYNRPDLVMAKLPFLNAFEISLLEGAYYKRLEKLGIEENKLNIRDQLPVFEVNYAGDYSTKTDLAVFTLKAKALGEDHIDHYTYILNGIEYKTELSNHPTNFADTLQLTLSPGINQIEFYCRSSTGVKSLIHKEVITCEKHFDKPDLYFVSIGLSAYLDSAYQLNYARKDAEEMAKIFEQTRRYGNVHQKLYLDSAMTSGKLTEIVDFLKQAKPNDVVILFYAGHGVLNQKLEYYLATYDMSFNRPEVKGIQFDVLENSIENLPCRNKLMLIDACHSGELDESSILINPAKQEKIEDINFRMAGVSVTDEDGLEMGLFELSKLLFIDMRLSKGTNIISSASGTEYAIEGEAWKNGVFTYVLKQALQDKTADLNGDRQIRVMELQIYLRNEVSVLSKGKQNPISRKENVKNNFVVW